MARWLATGTTKIIAAMKTAGVPRIVQLASFGIGDDYIPFRGISILWACLLQTIIRGALTDLRKMESVVWQSSSEVDFLLVRTVGIAPELPPTGNWRLYTSDEDAKRKPM